MKCAFCFFVICSIFLIMGNENPRIETSGSLTVKSFWLRITSTSFSSIQRKRLVVSRPTSQLDLPLSVYIALDEIPCERSENRNFVIKIQLDGSDIAHCRKCSCLMSIGPVSDGPHMISAFVYSNAARVLASRAMLVSLRSDDGSGEGAPHCASGTEQEILQEYTALHRRILDPGDHSVPKRFLVVSSSHGLANTQIEEVQPGGRRAPLRKCFRPTRPAPPASRRGPARLHPRGRVVRNPGAAPRARGPPARLR